MTDFRPRSWRSDGLIRYVASECDSCHRRGERERSACREKSDARRIRERLASRAYRRRKTKSPLHGPRIKGKTRAGSLPSVPLVHWLERKHAEYGSLQLLAHECDTSERRLRTIMHGYAIQGGKLRPIDRVDLGYIDRILLAEGSTQLDDLYPLTS